MEASTVTGPAKNLFEFACRAAAGPGGEALRAEVSIATYLRHPNHRQPNAFIAEARARGLVVDVVEERRAFDPQVLPQLREIVAARRPDIVQSHHVKSHFLVRLAGLQREHRWVAFHHGYTATTARVHLYNQLDRFSLPAADRCVTVCEAFAGELRGIGVRPERISIRHNMIGPFEPPPDEAVERLRLSLGVDSGTLAMLSVGRLSREKGHLDLVEAIGLLRDRGGLPPFVTAIVGEGPERPRIERRCRELGLAGQILLAGQQSDLRPWYGMCDLVALPSHSEGSPNALLEAMGAGLPVVATSVGGTPEIAAHERDALLTPPHAPAALADGIARLLADAGLRERLGAAARDVVRRFSPEEYCHGMLRLYAGLVSGQIQPCAR